MMFGPNPTHLDDPALAELVVKGDEKAFAEVVRRHQDAVYGFAFRMLTQSQEAEDAAQEAFLRFYKTAGQYRRDACLRTYLMRIVKNVCIDMLRKKKPQILADPPDTPDPDTPLDLLEGALTQQALEKAIAQLPANQRTAILLRHVEQMSYKRIADIMDLSLGAVESLLVRARRAVRKMLVKQDRSG